MLGVLVFALLRAPSASAAYQSQMSRRSPTHPRVILAPREAAQATLRIVFHTGAADDGIECGLTRLSQHMLVESNGRVRREDFWRDLYAGAASLALETGVRHAAFQLTAPKQVFDGLAETLLKMTLDPALTPHGLSRAKELTSADELESGGLSDLIAFLASRTLLEGGQGGGACKHAPYGEGDSAHKIPFSSVLRHVREKLSPARATVILTGAFNARRLSTVVAKLKGGNAPATGEATAKQHVPLHWERWAPHPVHVQAQLLDLTSARDVAAAHVIRAILEERIQGQLRSRGVSYRVLVTPVIEEWVDLLLVRVPVATAGDASVEVELRTLLDALASGPLRPDELERNRRYVLAELLRVDGDSAALARALSWGAGRISWHSPEVVDAVRSLSEAELVRAARPWLSEGRSTHVRLGPSRAAGARR